MIFKGYSHFPNIIAPTGPAGSALRSALFAESAAAQAPEADALSFDSELAALGTSVRRTRSGTDFLLEPGFYRVSYQTVAAPVGGAVPAEASLYLELDGAMLPGSRVQAALRSAEDQTNLSGTALIQVRSGSGGQLRLVSGSGGVNYSNTAMAVEHLL